jgi:hypothetical protein
VFHRDARRNLEFAMKKFFLLLLVLGGVAVTHLGCESDARVDDDGAKIKVDVDD